MKQFDYEKYLKNNPLLKEENKPTRQTTGDEDADWMGEDFNPSKNPLMKTASDLYDTLLTDKKYRRKLDDYLVDEIIEDIIGKPFEDWESLSDRELKKIIPFLQAVIKWIDSKKEFVGLDMGWDGKQLTSTDDTEDMDEGFNPIRKMKDFAGEKGWTFSARRPTDEEDQIAREYMESQGKELGSVGVDRITGNINVQETNGDFRAILSPDGEELSAWEMDIHEAIGQENNYKKAALELVTLAKNLINRAGESLVMNSEVKKASMITDEDGLSELYYHLQDVLGELIGSEARAFTRGAKKIIVDKYNIEMTDEYGSPMKWK